MADIYPPSRRLRWRRALLDEPRRPRAVRESRFAHWLVVATVCIGAFMGQLDASIVTIATPRIRRDLHVSLPSVEWVALAYLLVLVATVSAVGRASDVFGRKLCYTYGFAVFTVASLGCGLAPTFGWLLAARIVQAVGAAMLQANSVALIRTNMAHDKLGRAIGLQGAAQAIGLALGPAVGGVLIAAGGWRWVFLVNIPVGVLGVVLGWVFLPRTRSRAPRTEVDWTGMLVLFPAVAALLWGLSRVADGEVSGVEIVAVALAAGLAALFIHVERRTATPLIAPRLFADRGFAVAIGAGLLGYLVLFGALFVTPLYLESVRGMSTSRSGLVLSVLPLMLAVTAPVGGLISDRLGSRTPTVAGLAVTAAGTGVLAWTTTGGAIAVAMAIVGLGLGLFVPANNALVARAGPMRDAGMVSGVLNMTRGIGTSLGIAVAGAAYAVAASARSGQAGADQGLRTAAVLLMIVAVLAAALTLMPLSRAQRA